MTRINIVPPNELTDQHLIAEYREITMVPAALKRTLLSKGGLRKNKISTHYTLNTGHVYFFYNKGKYLHRRYDELIREMRLRGFTADPNRVFPYEIFMDNGLYEDWIPTIEDYKIIRERIRQKIAMKPDWYRKTKKALTRIS
jgi:deoxyribonuclease (pyrimidine dimer)